MNRVARWYRKLHWRWRAVVNAVIFWTFVLLCLAELYLFDALLR